MLKKTPSPPQQGNMALPPLTINFATHTAQINRWAQRLASGATGLIALGGFALLLLSFNAENKLNSQQTRLNDLKTKWEDLAQDNTKLPSKQALSDLAQQIKRMRGLLGEKSTQVTHSLNQLEVMLPNPAFLRSFQQDRKTGKAALQAAAPKAADLTNFLRKIEKHPDFHDVRLVRRREGTYQKRRIILFDIEWQQTGGKKQ